MTHEKSDGNAHVSTIWRGIDDSTIEEQLAEKAKQEEKDKQTKEIEDRFKKDYEGKINEVKSAVKKVIYG